MKVHRLLYPGLIFLLLLYSASSPLYAQWQFLGSPENCQPVCIDAEGDSIVLLTSSGLFYSPDNAGTWTRIQLPNNSYLLKNVQIENGSLFVVSEHYLDTLNPWIHRVHTVYRSDDWGAHWLDISTSVDPILRVDKLIAKSDTLYLIGENTVYVSYDRGDSYAFDTPAPEGYRHYTLHEHFLYAAKLLQSNTSILIRTKDDWLTWDTIYTGSPENRINQVESIGGHLWKIETNLTESSTIISFSETNGASWIQRDTLYYITGGLNTVTGIYGAPDDLYLITDPSNPILLRSTDGGIHWMEVSSWEYAVGFFYLNNNIFKLSPQGLQVSQDHGATFNKSTKGITAATVEDLVFVDNTIWSRANYGVYSSKSGGASWMASTDLNAIAKTKDEHLVAAINGIPHRSDDNGVSWTVIPPEAFNLPFYYPIHSLACVENLMYIFTPSNIYYSADYGITWRLAPESQGHSICYNGKYVLNAGSSTVFSSENGIDWEPLPLPIQLKSGQEIDNVFWLDPYYFLSSDTMLLRLHKNSPVWEDVTIPRVDNEIVYPFRKNLPIISFSNRGNLLIASFFARGVFASLDFGKTWFDMNAGLTNLRALHLVKINTDLYLCTDGGVWRRPLGELAQFQYSGLVFSDKNADGLHDNDEPGVPHTLLTKKLQGQAAYSDADGSFIFLSDNDANDTLIIHPPSVYSTVTTPPIPVSASQTNLYAGIHFTPGIYDAGINITNLTPLRPGGETGFVITYTNKGTESADFRIALVLPDRIEFVSSSIAPALSGDTLIWIIQDVPMQQSGTLNINTKIDPETYLGTILEVLSLVKVIAGNDTNTSDNVSLIVLPVVGSYDPNDKVVLPTGYISPAMIADTQQLEYTIRFQNTGNYPASFVRIQDTLSSLLDPSSLEILAASHPFTWKLLPQNVFDVYFENINLPDSSTDERSSHGFVKFAINAKATLQVADQIENKASIYFDFNAPVVTNTVISTVGFETSIREPVEKLFLSASPVPTKDFVLINISSSRNYDEVLLTLYDSKGSFLKSQTSANLENIFIDMYGLPSGIYLLQARTSDATGIIKVLKN